MFTTTASILAYVLLALSGLFLLASGAASWHINHSNYADRAGASIQLIAIGVLQTLGLTVAFLLLVYLGRLDSLSSQRVLVAFVGVVLSLGIGALATALATAGVEARWLSDGLRSFFSYSGIAIAFGHTLYLLLVAQRVLPGRGSHLAVAVVCVLLMAAGGLWWLASVRSWNRENAIHQAAHGQQEAERQAEYQADRLRQLEAIPDSESLGKLLQFLGATEGKAVHARVHQRAAQRAGEVPALLEGNYCIEALDYLARDETPFHPEWAPSIPKAIQRVAEYVRKSAAEMGPHGYFPDTHSAVCTDVAKVLARYRSTGTDFKPAVTELLAALNSVQGKPLAVPVQPALKALIR